MSQLTDEQLLLQYQRGRTGAFTYLIGRYEKELFHFLIRFCGDRQIAEDLFQETFLQVHLSAHTFDTNRRFRPWIFTIGANKARDYLRREGKKTAAALSAPLNSSDGEGRTFLDLMEADLELPEEESLREETRQLVQQVLSELPEHLREALLLAYFHQFAYREIAQMLGIPLGTVKSRLHAAVAAFGEIWKKRHPKRTQ